MCSSTTFENLTNEDLITVYESYIPKDLHHGFYKFRGYNFTSLYENIQQSIEDLEVFDSDIWVTSVPKSGTTWLSETVWAICNDLKSPIAKTPLNTRVRFLEYSSLFHFDETDDTAPSEVNNSVRKVIDMPSPRFIKSHLPWQCLPQEIRSFIKRPRVIHVARDPKDVAVSFYHHNRHFRGFSGSPELFYEMFLRGLMRWSPYDKNVLSYWEQRKEPNVLFLKFEEMKKNMPGVIKKIVGFLNVVVSDDKMAELLQHLSFENMKKNKDLGVDDIVKYINDKYLHNSEEEAKFLRKGETGAHKSEMSAKMAARIDKCMKYSNIC